MIPFKPDGVRGEIKHTRLLVNAHPNMSRHTEELKDRHILVSQQIQVSGHICGF